MSRRESLDAVAELAADQWGLFTTAQSRQRGVSANDLARLRSAGAIRTVRHGVYTMPGAPASPLEPVRAEWLATDPGRTVAARSHDDHPVVLCDETAAAVYGMGDFTSTQIHFNAQRRLQTNQEWVHISQRSLARAEWHLVDGLPVTTPRRTLEDLAASGRWDADHIAAAVRDALTAGLISREDIGRSSTLLAVAPQLATPIGNASVLARLNDDARDRWKDYADAIEQASLVIDPALAHLASPDTRIGATEPPGPTVRTDGLTAPWLRTQLIEALSLLADRDWLVTNVGIDGLGSDALSGVLDLLDDTGAVDEPDQQVGAFLLRDEVDHARMLGRALESALGSAPGQWSSVSHAAKALLRQLLHEPGESDR